MNSTRPSVLFVLSRFPLPTDKGDRLRAWEQIKVLSAHSNVYVICFHDAKTIPDTYAEEIRKYVCEIRIFPITKMDAFLAGLRMFTQIIPFQVGYFYHPWFKKELRHFIREINPQTVFFQLIRMFPYATEVRGQKAALDLMDCMSHNILLRAHTEKKWIKWFWKWEYKRLLAYEEQAIQAFEHSYIISQRDKDKLPESVRHKVKIISNGIDTDTFTENSGVRNTDILFVGNLGYKPNIEACSWLIEEILPLLHQRNWFPIVRIVGSNPDRKVWKWAAVKGVHIHANVPETYPFYQDAKIMAAPMRINTGQQNKILEAMACGCNVVTTSNANDGIQAPESCLLVADNSRDFAELLWKLHRKELNPAAHARQFVLDHFSWKKNTEEWVSLIRAKD